MTKRDANACEEFGRAKWLREIIIGSVVECCDLLLFLIAGRQNDNGGLQPLTQFLQDLLAIHIRQTKIENDEVRRLLGSKANGLLSCLCLSKTVILCREGSAEESANRQFILNDQ